MIYKPCLVTAEACGNHCGKFDLALEMIKTAKLCSADFVKFQKRVPEESVPKEWHNKPHPVPHYAFGKTYLEHRKALEFSLEQHKKLFNYCQEVGIKYSCSTWDITSAREIISLNPEYIKVPSAANIFYPMLDILFNEYKGDIHISLGMITKDEKKELFSYLNRHLDRVVVYWAVTEYPVPFERLFLLEIENLKKVFPRVGYSGHNLGISVDVLTYCLGTEHIERHFTLDRTFPTSDSSASLEPEGLRKLCRDLKAAYKALNYKNIEMTDIEQEQRKKLKVNYV